MKLHCEKCGKLMTWPGTPERHPFPVLCDPCDVAVGEAALKRDRLNGVKLRQRSEQQKKEEPF